MPEHAELIKERCRTSGQLGIRALDRLTEGCFRGFSNLQEFFRGFLTERAILRPELKDEDLYLPGGILALVWQGPAESAH